MGIGFSYVNSRGVTYYLHTKVMKSRFTTYFFSKKSKLNIALPEGYTVVESERSGLLFLKKLDK